MKRHAQEKNGFTIIEVSLVLALAGLLFLMVFIALPALQRSGRDSERREDITLLLKQIKDYQSANRGALPTGETTGFISFIEDKDDAERAAKETDWQAFYQNYLGANFRDPSTDDSYRIEVVKCDGANISSTCSVGEIEDSMVKHLEKGEIEIVLQATCEYNDEYGYYTAVKSSNPRKVATLINLEASGAYCSST